MQIRTCNGMASKPDKRFQEELHLTISTPFLIWFPGNGMHSSDYAERVIPEEQIGRNLIVRDRNS